MTPSTALRERPSIERGVRNFMNPDWEWLSDRNRDSKFFWFAELHKGRCCIGLLADWAGGCLRLELSMLFIRIGFQWVYDPAAWDWSREQADQATFEYGLEVSGYTQCSECGTVYDPGEEEG